MLYRGNNEGNDALILYIEASTGGIVLAQRAAQLPLSSRVKNEEKVHKRERCCSGPC